MVPTNAFSQKARLNNRASDANATSTVGIEDW
jgi:hypothetical protein